VLVLTKSTFFFHQPLVLFSVIITKSRTSPSFNTVSSVNTVDTLYSALPAFLYFNPEIAGYLLAPLLEYQDSALYTLPYAAKNLGE
jgi:Domain of unknown function (DUF4965)